MKLTYPLTLAHLQNRTSLPTTQVLQKSQFSNAQQEC